MKTNRFFCEIQINPKLFVFLVLEKNADEFLFFFDLIFENVHFGVRWFSIFAQTVDSI